jgi:hypothetical protein
MDICEVLKNSEFPEFSLDGICLPIDVHGLLALYGSYCMENMAKSCPTEIQNRNNRHLYFVSEKGGRVVTLEIRNDELIERIKMEYNRFCDGYECVSKDSYELFYRESPTK